LVPPRGLPDPRLRGGARRRALAPARGLARLGGGLGAGGGRPRVGVVAFAALLAAEPGSGRLLRAQDRLPPEGRTRPFAAVRARPGGLRAAGALRARVPREGQPPAPPGHGPPGRARLVRALDRDPPRAVGGRLPALARARAGAHPPRRRGPRPVGRRGPLG